MIGSSKTSWRKQTSFRHEKQRWDRWLSTAAVAAIVVYQRGLSPLLGRHCRFYPSCSQYAKEAFQRRPFFLAFWLAFRRLLKCNPFHPGGYDPLDPPDEETASK